jgi:hypothetical protein
MYGVIFLLYDNPFTFPQAIKTGKAPALKAIRASRFTIAAKIFMQASRLGPDDSIESRA